MAAAKDAMAQAAGEEQPEGDEEEMIDVAAATDAPSMEEVSPSHHSSIFSHSSLSATIAFAHPCLRYGIAGCRRQHRLRQVPRSRRKLRRQPSSSPRRPRRGPPRRLQPRLRQEVRQWLNLHAIPLPFSGRLRCVTSLLHLPALPV